MAERDSKKDALEDLERDLKAVQGRDTPESPLRTNVDAPVSPVSPTHPGSVSHHDAADDGRVTDASRTGSADPVAPKQHRGGSDQTPDKGGSSSKYQGTAMRWAIGLLGAALVLWLLLTLF